MNPDTGEATDDLQPQVIEKFKSIGSKCTKVSQVRGDEDKEVFKAIWKGINHYNTVHLRSNAQKVTILIVQCMYVCVCVCMCVCVCVVCVYLLVSACICVYVCCVSVQPKVAVYFSDSEANF